MPTATQSSASVDEATVYVTDLQLATRYGVSRATVWRWASGWSHRNKNGELVENPPIIPRPVKIGPGSTRWILEDVIAAIGY